MKHEFYIRRPLRKSYSLDNNGKVYDRNNNVVGSAIKSGRSYVVSLNDEGYQSTYNVSFGRMPSERKVYELKYNNGRQTRDSVGESYPVTPDDCLGYNESACHKLRNGLGLSDTDERHLSQRNKESGGYLF